MNVHDRISMFQEVATCQYQMIISTPRLCQEMMLASQLQSDAHRITCDPIVPDHQMMEEDSTRTDAMAAAPVETDTSPAETSLQQEKNGAENAHQAIESESLDRESLLSMIDDLTVRISQLQQQIGIADPNAFQDELDVAFYHVDDSGALVHDDAGSNPQMRELVESYVKMLDARKSEDRDEERPTREADVADNEEQRKNKEAYTKHYR